MPSPLPIASYYQPHLNINKNRKDAVPLDSDIVFPGDADFEQTLILFRRTDIFAFDLETFSYNYRTQKLIPNGALDPFQNAIRLIQVGLPNRKVILVELDGINPKPIQYPRQYAKFFEILEEKLYCNDTKVIGHNLAFDLLCARVHLGFKARNCRDTMLMSQILWSGVGVKKAVKGTARKDRGIKGFHSLGLVAQRLGFQIDKGEQVSDWTNELTNKQYNYAATDVQILFKIYEPLRKLLLEESLTFSIYAECHALPHFVEMQYQGYPVDKETLETTLQAYLDAEEKILEPFYTSFGKETSPTTTKKDLVPLIKEVLDIEVDAVGASDLATKGHPALDSLLSFRTLGISTKYLSSLKKACEISEITNPEEFGYRIRLRLRQIATHWRTAASGKLYGLQLDQKARRWKESRTDAPLAMNLQQIPNLHSKHEKLGLPSVRTVFKVPTGYKLIILDLSQAHTRIAAQLSKDPGLVAGYNEGLDNHLKMATRILQLEDDLELGNLSKKYDLDSFEFEQVETIYKEAKVNLGKGAGLTELESLVTSRRQYGKVGFYSFLNQAGAATMQTTFHKEGIDVSLEYCQLLKKALCDYYAPLRSWILKAVNQANKVNVDFKHFKDLEGKPVEGEYGAIRGLTGGRTYCLKQPSKFHKELQIPFTDSISFMWLSSEASMIKKAIGDIYLDFCDHPEWGAWLCLFNHDEIDVCCKEEYAEIVANTAGKRIKESLERYIKIIPVEESSDYNKAIGDSMDSLH